MITEALAALPKDLGDDLLVKAEAVMVDKAAEFGPRELRVFGPRGARPPGPRHRRGEPSTDGCSPKNAAPHAATRLSLRPRGDGSTDLHARIPDHAAGRRLRAYLNAFTAPRRRHLDDQPASVRPTVP